MFELLEFNGKRVTVMGLGRFGGGVGAVRFLAEQGARVTVTDLLTEEQLGESLRELDDCRLHAVKLGGHDEADFCDADLVVVNPAVPPQNEFVQLARSRNVPLTTEIGLFWRFNPAPVVGVTGTNGKSTTAAMIHAILCESGHNALLGGNIGISLLPALDTIGPDDWVVLELSSFQLADLDRLPSSPHAAVVTNFHPNHLDWHGSTAEYRRAKQTILRWQTPRGIAVLNQSDSDLACWPSFGRRLGFGIGDTGRAGVFTVSDDLTIDAGVLYRSEGGAENPLAIIESLRLPGRHNVENALAAACAALAAGATPEAVERGLANFYGLPHRLQFVAEVNGCRFYNDSLATTPESVRAAMEAFEEPVVLLAGGYDKQVDLSPLAEGMARGTKAVALMGQTAPLLDLLLDRYSEDHPRRECESFEDAFNWACAQASAGDVVLLSPGCASYDWFSNFAERGEEFMRMVHGLRN